jgi:serine phosphatase RsbU (regulator of sigma subunit)
VTNPGVDYAAVFRALPGAVALISPQLEFLDANAAYLRLSGRTPEQVLGRYVFDVFPANPGDPEATTGLRNMQESLRRVLETGEPESLGVLRYDVESPDRPGEYTVRYWSPISAPVHGPDGRVALIISRVEEVTELIRARISASSDETPLLEAEVYTRARELQEVNERLRQSHAREREVAVALQEAMLPALRPLKNHQAAVRYRPAASALNVCGDWYDVVELPADRVAVAVGDVVGHGLDAACVMGQLRSALSAATRVAAGPSQALDVLGLYARSLDGAESTTAASAVVDWGAHTITYSSAGHPPPALLHANGTVQFLDQATDPPLGARPEHVPRIQAAVPFANGTTAVFYTDGLIERRFEDIDVGLARLAGSLSRNRDADPETQADALLAELLPSDGVTDDAALVIVRL